ncbi:MAG: hypothetical protein LBF67_02840 [Prevotellaceae bacterium]|nr:hypothetical protein [Prevotellaceae bacterium]
MYSEKNSYFWAAKDWLTKNQLRWILLNFMNNSIMKITHLKCALTLFSSFIFLSAGAQTLPEAYTTDWSFAGYSGELPEPADILTPSGLDKIGATDMSSIVNAAIATQSGKSNGGVVYLPEGAYLFRQSISMKSNVVLRGAGADKTRLNFDLSGSNDPIIIKGSLPGSSNPEQPLGLSAARGSSAITLKNNPLPNVANGKMAMLYRQPGLHAYPGDSWAKTGSCMQMLHVAQVSGKQVTFAERLRSDFKVADSAGIRIVSAIHDVGLENFLLTCLNKQYSGENAPANNNIAIDYADNCWITGVESAYSNSAHVNVRRSSNIQISGCYFHHAHGWGSGGSGYGVCLTGGAGQTLVANCIFDSLRHAMLAQGFANGNVFAYNYSARTNRTESPHDAAGDIILHGNYAHSNLYQYNVGNTLSIDNPHGANGPRNVFLRNRLTRYGIYILAQRNNASANQQLAAGIQNDSTALIANEATHALKYVNSTYSYGDYRIFTESRGNIEIGNRQQGNPAGGNTPDADSYLSFYNSSKPLFWDIDDHWFALGSQSGASIPAVERYNSITALKTDGRKKLFAGCTSAKPIVSNQSYYAGDTARPLSAVGEQLRWYAAEYGGVGSDIAPVPSTSKVGVQTFYASQTEAGCAESDRAAITVTVSKKETTSVEAGLSKVGVKIFPNPFTDALYVDAGHTAEVCLYGMGGAMMLRRYIDSEGCINTSQLPAGAYVLKVKGRHINENRVVVLDRNVQ